MSDLQSETVAVLRQLIRMDTVNPPGRERPAQELLAGYLSQAGLEVELLGAEPDRPNLVARLPGRAPGPTLCLLGHVDTVLADREAWSHDPWSADEVDGVVFGRGAMDMKSQVAGEAVAAATLARSGWRPARGELLVVFVADEETGGELGAAWLCREHPERVRCDLLINEGGGDSFMWQGRRVYGVGCAEKGVFRFTLSTSGAAGHASMPGVYENALLRMAPILARLAERQPSFDVTEEPRALLEALGLDPTDPRAALERLRAADPLLGAVVEPMLGVTLAPTRIQASEKINVIPARAELQVDCRVPPGLGEAEARRRIEEVLGSHGYRLEFCERIVGNRSPASSPLMDTIARWVETHDGGARVAPTVLPGFTDSRHFRAAFPDCLAYGFFPRRQMSMQQTLPLMHSADERIDVRDVGFAATFFADLAQELLGSESTRPAA